MQEITRYELDKTRKSLVVFFDGGEYYQIHPDNMLKMEKWILKVLQERWELRDKATNWKRDLIDKIEAVRKKND